MKANQKRIDKGLYWDRAWSLVEGCSYVSAGCEHCWGAAQAHIRSHQKNPKIRERYSGVTDADGRWNGKIKFLHENLELPLKVKRPTVWSVWNDLFHEDMKTRDIEAAIGIMSLCAQHTFLVLTKRPDRMAEWFSKYDDIGQIQSELPFRNIEHRTPIRKIERGDSKHINKFPLPNLYLGVTAENQQTADERISILLQIPAKVRFVSVEPQLESIKYSMKSMEGISWFIDGCETGHGRRDADIDWFRYNRDFCNHWGINYFHKKHYQDGKPTRILDGRTHEEYPE